MNAWLDWLGSLPAPLLYAAIGAAAFAENVFPPLPADTVVALGAFVAARGNGTALGAWTATMIGNLAGAMSMFALGRRMGMGWLSQRLPRVFSADAAQQVADRFRTRGMAALVVSRFLPAVRALVPPVAGALRLPVLGSALAMALASGLWYGIVCVLAYRTGANAEALLARIAAQQQRAALIAGGVVLLAALVWWARRRSRRDG